MIEITPSFSIDESELQFSFVRSSGPGGQNVNKVATAAQLRFDVKNSSLADEVKDRLTHMAGKRINNEGVLLIEARKYRTQERNREEAIDRFVDIIRRAFEKPKARKKTKPTAGSKVKRLEKKRQRGEIKKIRQTREWE